jgi:fatty acid-binding protein DegV
MKIAISAETTIDMPKELLEKYNIHTTAFTILLGEETKLDGELKSDEIFEYVQKTKILPKTSAINEFQYTEHFEKLLADYLFFYTQSSLYEEWKKSISLKTEHC